MHTSGTKRAICTLLFAMCTIIDFSKITSDVHQTWNLMSSLGTKHNFNDILFLFSKIYNTWCSYAIVSDHIVVLVDEILLVEVHLVLPLVIHLLINDSFSVYICLLVSETGGTHILY